MSVQPESTPEEQTVLLTFDLFEIIGTRQDGSLKTTEELKEGEQTYWLSKTSSYDVSVTELLKIDGWNAGQNSKPMTLFIMQFDFHRERADVRIESINASITFEDVQNAGDSDKLIPTVVTMEPYGLDRTNKTTAEKSYETTMNADGGGGGLLGGQVMGGGSRTWSSSYAQEYFHEIEGWMTKSTKDRRQNGAKWTMFQNKSQKFGVSPVVQVAVLVRRNQPGKWNAFFELKVKSQFWEDVKQNVKRSFQIAPDKTMIPLYSSSTASTHPTIEVDTLGRLETKGELVKLLQQL